MFIASEELRGDKEVVLTDVKQNGHSYKYACNELLDDEDILDVYESFAIANQLCIKVRRNKH